MSTHAFVINQLPQFSYTGGQVTSMLLLGGPIFTRMTQITIVAGTATSGNLQKVAIGGTFTASASTFTNVYNAVQGMLSGDTRTLELTGDEHPTYFAVTAASVDAPGARFSEVRDLLGSAKADTGTGTEG